MKEANKPAVIRCPHCGAEYLACEIFIPGAFLGRSETVVKDVLGKILYDEYEDGEEPNFTEHYVCDNCNKPFVIEATVSYRTREEAEELDFSNETTSLLD